MALRAVRIQSLRNYVHWRSLSGLLQSGRIKVLNGSSFFGRVRSITSPALWSRNFSSVVPCRQSSSWMLQSPQILLQRSPPACPLPSPHPQFMSPQQVRCLVKFSRNKGKRKTVKAVAKRFHRTGSGKLKYWPPGKVHNMLAKSRKKRRQLRKPRYATKTQLKTLNKMLAGW